MGDNLKVADNVFSSYKTRLFFDIVVENKVQGETSDLGEFLIIQIFFQKTLFCQLSYIWEELRKQMTIL